MKIIPDIKATFGDTYFLGFTEKKRFDPVTNKIRKNQKVIAVRFHPLNYKDRLK